MKKTQTIAVDTTQCNFGGARKWMICPVCGVRRVSLYLNNDGKWACRACLGLSYYTQRLSPHQRHAHMAQKIKYKKLNAIPGSGLANRPKGMWKTTHTRLLLDIIERERKSANHFHDWIKKLKNKYV